jgi:hypothetical protein
MIETLADFCCRFLTLVLAPCSGSLCTLDGNGNKGPVSGTLPVGLKRFCCQVQTLTAYAPGDSISTVRRREVAKTLGFREQVLGSASAVIGALRRRKTESMSGEGRFTFST